LASGWRGRDVISILDFTRGELEELFLEADKVKMALRRGGLQRRPLEGKLVALAFFEPSTRTRMSFEAAAKRLGAGTIGFTGPEGTSVEKGENLADTIRMLDAYADLIVIRHRYEGSALYAAEIAEAPVVNGGDGRQHHPTQAMIDLYTVREAHGRVEGLDYAVVGDLRYGRAAASFMLALTIFRPRRLYLVYPPQLAPRREVVSALERAGVRFERAELEEVIGEVDVLYVTRIQRERFPDPEEYERVRGSYRVTASMLEGARDSLVVLHPLPRVDEIDHSVDSTRHAWYFRQARNGVPVRMALLKLILGG